MTTIYFNMYNFTMNWTRNTTKKCRSVNKLLLGVMFTDLNSICTFESYFLKPFSLEPIFFQSKIREGINIISHLYTVYNIYCYFFSILSLLLLCCWYTGFPPLADKWMIVLFYFIILYSLSCVSQISWVEWWFYRRSTHVSFLYCFVFWHKHVLLVVDGAFKIAHAQERRAPIRGGCRRVGGFGAGWKTSLRWQRLKMEGGLNPCSEVGADSQEVQSGRGWTHPVRPSPAWLSHSVICTQQNGDVILPW